MIIHKVIFKEWKDGILKYHRDFYLCNQAVIPNEEKYSRRWNKVNCKNCLKQIPNK